MVKMKSLFYLVAVIIICVGVITFIIPQVVMGQSERGIKNPPPRIPEVIPVEVKNTPLSVQGEVSVGNTPNVNVKNTPNVNVANSPTVQIGNVPLPVQGEVNIKNIPLPVQGVISVGNVPNVNVANTPTVHVGNLPLPVLGDVNVKNAPNVNVVNTPTVHIENPSLPVFGDVNVKNTPNVNVANTPTVQVSSTPANPVYVQNVSGNVQSPFQISQNCPRGQVPYNDCTLTLELPQGKQFEIQFFSAFANLPTRLNTILMTVSTHLPGSDVNYYLKKARKWYFLYCQKSGFTFKSL